MKKFLFIVLAIVLIGCDQATKYYALQDLDYYQPLSIFSLLNLRLAFNTGAAFSFLSEAGHWHLLFFTLFSGAMSVLILVWLLKTKNTLVLQCIALSLLLAGAVGNFIDRLHYGFVIDFIDFHYKNHHFPVFNLADTWICLGIVFLAFIGIFKGKTD